MAPNLLSIARLVVILISLGLIAFLLWQGELPVQLRVVVLAALAYYAVRLWVLGSRARRQRASRRRPAREQGEGGEEGPADSGPDGADAG